MAVRVTAALTLLLLRVVSVSGDCESFGVDFQSGGTYFQNITSDAAFTFVSTFEGCQNDVVTNILVDPEGDEYPCSDTPLLPADTPELSTCQIDKDQLTSGEWSVLLLSNNGNAEPIAFERDFSIIAGTPTTVTITPTLTVTFTTVPILNLTTTSTELDSTTVTSTTTLPAKTIAHTTTEYPKTTITTTKPACVYTKTIRTVIPVYKTVTETASCTIPHKQPHPDPICTKKPTHYGQGIWYGSKFHGIAGKSYNRKKSVNKAQWLKERSERFARLPKRDIDSSITTVTFDDSTLFPTVTSTITADTSTVPVTVEATTTTTFTDLITKYKGVTTVPTVTVTGATTTKTKTTYTKSTATITKTKSPTVVVTTTVTPTKSASACWNHGGWMW